MKDWYRMSRMAGEVKPRDYSWVSIDTPKEISSKTIKFAESIPERELYIEKEEEGEIIHGKGWQYGVEDSPHITVLWGIHTKDARKVKKILQDHKGGIVKLGQVGMFKADDYDVLKVNIISHSLHRLNGALKEGVKYSSTHPKYQPHITLAYLKCGNGEKYIKDRRFQNLQFDFNEVIFEDYNDKITNIKLF